MNVTRHAPETKDALLELLAGNTAGLYVLGGGTDIAIQIRAGEKRPQGLIWLGNLPEAKGIRETDAGLEIGAMTTMAELAAAPALAGAALSQAAGELGSVQIRNTATLGGNIANAAPAADTLPPLMLLNAEVQIASAEGIDWRPVESILPGGQLKPGEVILSVRFPRRNKDWHSAFCKLGSRRTVTISRLSLALGFRLEDGRIQEARAFAGAIALKPLELIEAGAELNGRQSDEEAGRLLGAALKRLVEKSIPDRQSMPYKAWAAPALGADIMEKIKQAD
ncbi:MAG: FAD binding domain-containing protein [Spirochaetes bacterium]|nr:FAD binding domain-containing protein [Spirochaetota bacterium]